MVFDLFLAFVFNLLILYLLRNYRIRIKNKFVKVGIFKIINS